MTSGDKVPVGLDPTITKRDIFFTVEAEGIGETLKVARLTHNDVKHYTMVSDEGRYLGGRGSAPPPLAYFSAAYAF
jgi:hypothetical protein